MGRLRPAGPADITTQTCNFQALKLSIRRNLSRLQFNKQSLLIRKNSYLRIIVLFIAGFSGMRITHTLLWGNPNLPNASVAMKPWLNRQTVLRGLSAGKSGRSPAVIMIERVNSSGAGAFGLPGCLTLQSFKLWHASTANSSMTRTNVSFTRLLIGVSSFCWAARRTRTFCSNF